MRNSKRNYDQTSARDWSSSRLQHQEEGAQSREVQRAEGKTVADVELKIQSGPSGKSSVRSWSLTGIGAAKILYRTLKRSLCC